MIDFIFDVDSLETGGEWRFMVSNFCPERPASACSNPDSPLFSDHGDPCEFEVDDVYFYQPAQISKNLGEPNQPAILEKLPFRLQCALIESYNDDIIERGHELIRDREIMKAEYMIDTLKEDR